MGLLPSYSAIENMVHSWFDPQSYVLVPWRPHSSLPFVAPAFKSSNPSDAWIGSWYAEDDLCRAVKIDPVTWPTRKIHRNRPESGRPDCFGGSVADLHHQKLIPAGRFRFSSPKTRKTRTDRKISKFRPKFPDSGKKFQFPVRIFQNPARIFQNPAKKPRFRWHFP